MTNDRVRSRRGVGMKRLITMAKELLFGLAYVFIKLGLILMVLTLPILTMEALTESSSLQENRIAMILALNAVVAATSYVGFVIIAGVDPLGVFRIKTFRLKTPTKEVATKQKPHTP